MNSMKEKRECRNCGELIHGRIDKKFCDDHCRNHHNNQINAMRFHQIRTVNKKLKYNWNILQDLHSDGEMKVSKDILHQLGFKFEFVTGVKMNNQKIQSLDCYNYSLTMLSDRSYELRRLN